MKRKIEILSPAGSYESMKAAIAAGADAVYIGGSRFGARAYADNLTEEQLLEAIDYVHLMNICAHTMREGWMRSLYRISVFCNL